MIAAWRAEPVVLVTGAGGEIGHGLIHEIAERGTFDILALDVRPLDARASARRCAAVRVGDILDRHLLDRLHAEFEIAVIFHLAALLSTRAEFVPETAHAVNVQGTLNLLAPGHRGRARAGAAGEVPLPQLDRGLRAAGRGHQARGGQGRRGRLAGADHDLRLHQAALRAPRAATTRATTASWRRSSAGSASTSGRSASLACCPPSRSRAAGPATMRRRCSTPPPRIGRTPASCARTRAFPSWRCPTPSRPCWRCMDAPAASLTDAGLQRGRPSAPTPPSWPTACARRFPGPQISLRARCASAGHRRFLAGGCRRRARARRLGLPPGVRSRPRVRRVPAPPHQAPLCAAAEREETQHVR